MILIHDRDFHRKGIVYEKFEISNDNNNNGYPFEMIKVEQSNQRRKWIHFFITSMVFCLWHR